LLVIVVVPEIKQKPCQFLKILVNQGFAIIDGWWLAKKSRVFVTDRPGVCYEILAR
jgi:hypothetical protein